MTTIAWRIAHVVVGASPSGPCNHFGGDPGALRDDGTYAGAADRALRPSSTRRTTRGRRGVRRLGEEGLARPVGAARGPWAESPYADLVLHINRELIHHGAEICLLRDLYRADPTPQGDRMSRTVQVTFDCRRPERPRRLLERGARLPLRLPAARLRHLGGGARPLRRARGGPQQRLRLGRPRRRRAAAVVPEGARGQGRQEPRPPRRPGCPRVARATSGWRRSRRSATRLVALGRDAGTTGSSPSRR